MTTWVELRKRLGSLAQESGEWSGMPMLVEGLPLRMAKGHPYEHLNGKSIDRPDGEPAADSDGAVYVNSWYSIAKRGQVVIWREANGELCHAIMWDLPCQRASLILQTMGALLTYDINAERRAQKKLRSLIKPHLFDAYILGGAFIETSKRSGITYVFRRLAPTIAFGRSERGDGIRVIAALCLHPIGYYGDTPLGVMVPTDDVIAHLVLMRGCEHRFWKQAYQHSIHDWRSML